MLFQNGSIYRNHSFVACDLRTLDDKICEIGTALKPAEDEEIHDLTGLKMIPGFIDIHTHGAVGIDVNHASADDLEKMSVYFASCGTTGWLCSVLTDTEEITMRAIDAFLEWQALRHDGAILHGIHLEGPFLSPAYKGAMPERLLRLPDIALVRRYQERAKGNIRYITIAPELPGALELIPALKEMGICVAIGHSAADYDTTMQAIRAGAVAATHTGNAMRLLHQREPAIFGAVLEERDVFCEMICDGLHLHPATIRLILNAKGTEQVVAITDSVMAAGLGDGEYMLGVNEIVVKDGDATLKEGGSRAGSTLTLDRALRNLVQFSGRSLESVIPLLTENPARLFSMENSRGVLAPDRKADLVVIDEDLCVRMTVVEGRVVFRGDGQI